MKSIRILTVGAESPEMSDLHRELSRNRLYDLKSSDFPDLTFGKVPQDSMDLAVMNLEILNSAKVAMISDFRELGYESPFLVLARWVDHNVYANINRLPKVVVLEKPYAQKDLWGLVNRLTEGREARQRCHRRFFTNQAVVLETFSGGKIFSGNMTNLSRGGACFESDEPLTLGEIMRFHVPLKDVGKSYNVNVKVVWTTPPKEAKRAGAGLEFVKAGDVYRNLLAKI